LYNLPMAERFVRVTCGREGVCPIYKDCKEVGAMPLSIPEGRSFADFTGHENRTKPLKNCSMRFKRWRSSLEIAAARVGTEVKKVES